MKIKSIFLKSICLWLSQLLLSSSAVSQNTLQEVKAGPSNERAILRIPKDVHGWKKFKETVKEDFSEIFLIPANLDPENCPEVLCLQVSESKETNKHSTNIEKYALRSHLIALDSNPGKKTTWNVIRTGELDLLFEKTVQSPDKVAPTIHTLSRVILTEMGYIFAGFMRVDKLMSKEERQKWIEVLEGLQLIDERPVSLKGPE